MLHKLFGRRKLNPPFGSIEPVSRIPVEERSFPLKIIHAGGRTEYYYMAVPAHRIMEKYPSFILARPEIFRRPWDSVVQPDEILVPGQKFFIVPLRTVKKLRRRIRKPIIKDSSVNSFVSKSSIDESAAMVCEQQDEEELTSKSFLPVKVDTASKSIISTLKSRAKSKALNHHVRFAGIDGKMDNNSVSMEKKGNKGDDGVKKSSNGSEDGENKRRVRRNEVTWEPKLTVIAETHCSEE